MAVKEMFSLALVCLSMRLTGAFYSSEPTYHRCCASGDPHYYPFDGGAIHFQGTCRYLMAGTCLPCAAGVEDFDVYVENEASPWNPSVSVTKSVEIHYKGWKIWFGRNGVFSVQPYGGTWHSPIFPVGSTYTLIPDAIVTRPSTNHLVFETYDGITVEFSDNHRVCVTVPCKYKRRMCGICGNLNDIMDDYVTSGGVDVSGSPSMATQIGNSWQVAPGDLSQLPDHCDRVPVIYRGTVDFNPVRRNVGMCAHLQRTTTSLAVCIQKLPELAEQYFDSCTFDLNAQTNIANAHCDTIEAFVRECQQLVGIDLPNWRRELQCPCARNVYEDPCPTRVLQAADDFAVKETDVPTRG